LSFLIFLPLSLQQNQMRFFKIFMVLLISVVFYSCKKDPGDCFKSTGEVIKEERQFEDFSTIVLNDNIDLLLIPSNSNTLTVSAGKNIMSKIITETKGDTLVISNNNSCNWVRSYSVPIEVSLPVNHLNEIIYQAIGNINCSDTIFSDSLSINVIEGAGDINIITNSYLSRANIHYGTADLKLRGVCVLSFVYSVSFGLVDNRELKASQIYAITKSSNDIYLNAQNILSIEIGNIGNVYYKGNPEISLSGSGSGQLLKLDE
jgi:hypothetical protein